MRCMTGARGAPLALLRPQHTFHLFLLASCDLLRWCLHVAQVSVEVEFFEVVEEEEEQRR